ncbi:MAG: DUF2380 domain-containing protein [Cocleimonas sp.]|nr:DUF2380 domain-containing protein [Cocleimonas sp.]
MNTKNLCISILIIVFSTSVNAATRIAILDFELIDLTLLANRPTERTRTASMKPLLEKTMKNIGGYEIIQINTNEISHANAGIGYLYKYHDIAASLGKQCDVDWVIVGQHSKSSFLYSYIKAKVIKVKTSNLEAQFDIELKGTHRKVTEHGIKSLAKKMTKKIGQ